MTCTEPNYGPKVSWSDGKPVAPRSEPLRDAYYSRVVVSVLRSCSADTGSEVKKAYVRSWRHVVRRPEISMEVLP